MKLNNLINEGEKIEKDTEKEFYNGKNIDEKCSKWIDKSISYLEENYPNSVLTSDFISESEKADKDYHNMVAILKGLMDVERELGFLHE